MLNQISFLLISVLVVQEMSCKASEEGTTVTYSEAGVMVAQSDDHHREKREVHQDMRGFNHEEKMEMLRRHNHLRSERKASDMMMMEWDDKLAESAQKWAEQCIFEHSDDRNDLAGYRYVGENLYAGTHKFDPATVVQLWYDEVEFYNYNTMGCTEVCGHYTQVVWATSKAVGCGVKYCPQLKSASFGKGYHVACHYGPGGNYIGQRPYDIGDPCSKCSKDRPFCVKGLCSVRPQIGSGAKPSCHINLELLASVCAAFLFLYLSLR